MQSHNSTSVREHAAITPDHWQDTGPDLCNQDDSVISEATLFRWLYAQPLPQYIESIPGVGPTTAQQLLEAGYETADQLFGRFLMEKRDVESFSEILRECGVHETVCKRIALVLEKRTKCL